MSDIQIFKNENFGEIRVGIDSDVPEETFVSLALNHLEDDEQWGGQPLSPSMARRVGCILIEYAAKAEQMQRLAIKKKCPF